jgi:hypothetical protein
MKKRAAKDALGSTIRTGDIVRVIGVPDLRGMSPAGLRSSRPAFRHILGTYRKICGFDRYGCAEIDFRIRRGPHAGWHTVYIEPHLLRRKQVRHAKRLTAD